MNKTAFYILTLLLLSACNANQQPEQKTNTAKQAKEVLHEEFAQLYSDAQLQGSFVLYDNQADTYHFYNKNQYEQLFTPASTFKICNALIGLETAAIPDEHFLMKWDGTKRRMSAWNQDQDLKNAFKNSTVWYYQALAKRVGIDTMKAWLDKLQYGNADTTGGITQFWLSGDLRISPKQQIDFLKRLYHNQLPLSQRSMDIVKNIMIAKDTLGYTIRAKTGWGFQDNKDIGWYVGYAEKMGKAYFFANCVQTADSSNTTFGKARIDISYQILDKLIFTQHEH